MWYSKHHYAAQLARDHDVHFVSMPPPWRPGDLFRWGARTTRVIEGVRVVELRNTLPRKLGAFVARWNGRKLMRLDRSGRPLCWCFHPLAVDECEAMHRAGARLIYHAVDAYQVFPEDVPMSRMADLVVAINPWFMEHYAQYNAHRILIPHGSRRQDRIADPAAAQRWRDRLGRYALFAATLSDDTNYALLIAAAERFPDLRFAVAGSRFTLRPENELLRARWLAMPNVEHLGVLHPDALKDLVAGAEVGLLAYAFEPRRSIPITGVRTPLKVLTYLAQHRPLVSTNNSYIPDLDDRGSFKAEDPEHFFQLMREVLEGRLKVDVPAVDRYLDSVGYDRLAGLILDALDRAEKAP